MKIITPKTKFALFCSQGHKFDIQECTQIYHKQTNYNKPVFALLDGPPYANGHIHLGTMVNKIQKDIFNQLYYMRGFNVVYIPGWDCHGLPIEKNIEQELASAARREQELALAARQQELELANQQEQELALAARRESDIATQKIVPFDIKQVPTALIRAKCRSFANKWIEIQAEEFANLGVFASWDNRFKTMDNALSIMKKFHSFVQQGFVYKGLKPIMWSIAEQTSMATAEIEYKQHESTAIDVRFSVAQSKILPLDAYCVIWTTTPWTIPANRAIAYGNDIEYSLIEVNTQTGTQKLVIATNLIEQVCQRIGALNHTVLKTFQGAELETTVCKHPLYDFDVPLYHGQHVSDENGTGLVHIAPAHGEEDFVFGKEHDLEITDIVADNGTFQNTPIFAGMSFKQAGVAVLEHLGDNLLSKKPFIHSYPYSWRSHTPLIYKVTQQWYIRLKKLQERALQFSSQIKWIPHQSINRFESMLKSRGDWCVSRQRAWGTPLALFTLNDQPIFDPSILEQTQQFLQKNGIESWFEASVEEILGPLYEQFQGAQKVLDTLDVWFDAGSMQYAMSQAEQFKDLPKQVDLYLEGSDQHRGFFQACLIINAINDHPNERPVLPVKSILTHGFILDAKGRKMSKSLGNVIAPNEVIEKYGLDVVRLWVACTDCTEDIVYSQDKMNKIKGYYDRFRNTIRYLLGCLEDKIDDCTGTGKTISNPLHKALLAQFASLEHLLHTQQLQTFFQSLHKFCDEDLSKFYFNINKDSVYCARVHDSNRQEILAVYRILLRTLIKWLTPVLKNTCQEAWSVLNKDCVFLEQFESLDDWKNEEGVALWKECKNIKDAANAVIEPLRTQGLITQALQSRLIFQGIGSFTASELEYLTMVAQVEIKEANGSLSVQAYAYEGTKCDRCKRYDKSVKTIDLGVLCQRCSVVMQN